VRVEFGSEGMGWRNEKERVDIRVDGVRFAWNSIL